MRREIKLIFNMFIIGFFIIPFFSIITSHITYYTFKPKTQTIHLSPQIIDNTKIKMKYKYKLNLTAHMKINKQSTIYLVVTLPETKKNFATHSFYIKSNISPNFIHIKMEHKSSTHLFIDTLLFYPFIKLNLYKMSQTCRKKINVLEDFDGKLEFDIMSCMDFDEIFVDVLENSSWLKMMVYHHMVLYKFGMSLMVFVVLFMVTMYGGIFVYRKLGKVTQQEIQEIIEEEFIK